jgi:hypothetical protein
LLDTTNARYLWKRLPHKFKDANLPETKSLIRIWEMGKALTKKNYADAFKMLANGIPGAGESVAKLGEVLTRVLREEHVIKQV